MDTHRSVHAIAIAAHAAVALASLAHHDNIASITATVHCAVAPTVTAGTAAVAAPGVAAVDAASTGAVCAHATSPGC